MIRVLFLVAVLRGVKGVCQNGTVIASGLTCDEKQFIVDVHNQLRDKVAGGLVETQPKAANMVEMRWSEPVAETAQQWANECIFEHNADRELNGEQLGQNLAEQWSTADMFSSPDLEGMINDWFNEVYDYGYNGTFNYNSGHYSQLIWGNTVNVGCGLIYYKKEDKYYSYLVCNYLPPGNWIGEQPYDYGTRNCTAYDLVDSKTYSNLCAIDSNEIQVCGRKGSFINVIKQLLNQISQSRKL